MFIARDEGRGSLKPWREASTVRTVRELFRAAAAKRRPMKRRSNPPRLEPQLQKLGTRNWKIIKLCVDQSAHDSRLARIGLYSAHYAA